MAKFGSRRKRVFLGAEHGRRGLAHLAHRNAASLSMEMQDAIEIKSRALCRRRRRQDHTPDGDGQFSGSSNRHCDRNSRVMEVRNASLSPAGGEIRSGTAADDHTRVVAEVIPETTTRRCSAEAGVRPARRHDEARRFRDWRSICLSQMVAGVVPFTG